MLQESPSNFFRWLERFRVQFPESVNVQTCTGSLPASKPMSACAKRLGREVGHLQLVLRWRLRGATPPLTYIFMESCLIRRRNCTFLYRRYLGNIVIMFRICVVKMHISGPGSSVGIATELRAGRSGDRIPVGARLSALVQTGPVAHSASCTMGTGSFQGVRCGRGVTLTPHPLLVPRSKIE